MNQIMKNGLAIFGKGGGGGGGGRCKVSLVQVVKFKKRAGERNTINNNKYKSSSMHYHVIIFNILCQVTNPQNLYQYQNSVFPGAERSN